MSKKEEQQKSRFASKFKQTTIQTKKEYEVKYIPKKQI